MVNHAQDFKSEENAKKIAETLNLLYQLTNKKQRVKVVKEVVDRLTCHLIKQLIAKQCNYTKL